MNRVKRFQGGQRGGGRGGGVAPAPAGYVAAITWAKSRAKEEDCGQEHILGISQKICDRRLKYCVS